MTSYTIANAPGGAETAPTGIEKIPIDAATGVPSTDGKYMLLSVATTFVRTGTTTNDNAAAGQIGEYMSQDVASGVALPTSTPTVVASITLTAGDWDVAASVEYFFTNLSTITKIITALAPAVSQTPSNIGRQNSLTFDNTPILLPSDNIILSTPTIRYSLATSTLVWVQGRAEYTSSGGNATCGGFIWARRVR